MQSIFEFQCQNRFRTKKSSLHKQQFYSTLFSLHLQNGVTHLKNEFMGSVKKKGLIVLMSDEELLKFVKCSVE